MENIRGMSDKLGEMTWTARTYGHNISWIKSALMAALVVSHTIGICVYIYKFIHISNIDDLITKVSHSLYTE